MSNRRKKQREYDVREFLIQDLTEKVDRLMHNRHMLLAPFPVPPLDIYRLMWTNEEWEALALLRPKNNLFSQMVSITIGDLAIPKERGSTITVFLPTPAPMFEPNLLLFAGLPKDMQTKIKAWVPIWTQYRDETYQLSAKIEQVADVCTTYGQVFRIWPSLQGFFGDVGKEKVDKAKVTSRYPDKAMQENDTRSGRTRMLKREFRPEAYAPFSMMIAEALMLPFIEDNKHVAEITS